MSIYSYKRTPNEICVDLNEMGIESTFDSGTRQEQEIANIENWVGENWVAGYWIADGLIDIKEGPITWIAIGRDSNGGDSGGYPEGTDTSWMVYGIPDSKVSDSYPKVKLYPSRIKTFPIFGKVVDVRWRGKDFGLGVADRLYEDILIRNQLMVSLGVADDTGSGTEEVLGGSIGGWSSCQILWKFPSRLIADQSAAVAIP